MKSSGTLGCWVLTRRKEGNTMQIQTSLNEKMLESPSRWRQKKTNKPYSVICTLTLHGVYYMKKSIFFFPPLNLDMSVNTREKPDLQGLPAI